MSPFIEDLLRLHVLNTTLASGYNKVMAADQARENEAMAWCNAFSGDLMMKRVSE